MVKTQISETSASTRAPLFPPVVWMSAALAISLLPTLFPLPRPDILSDHPWKIELLTTLFLCVVFAWKYSISSDALTRIFGTCSVQGKWILRLLAAFALWGLISALWATSSFAAWHHSLIWAEFILFYLLASNQIAASGRVSFITNTFLWSVVLIGMLCVIDYLTVPDFKSLEGSLRIRYAKYAELLITVLPVVWMAAVYSRKRLNFALVMLAAALGWAAVMLSLSKGAFLAGLIGFVLMFGATLVFSSRVFRRRTLVALGIWLVVTVAVQAGFSLLSPIPSTTDFITGKAEPSRETTTMRVFVWSVAGQAIRDHWLLGVGADNFGLRFNDERARYRLAKPGTENGETADDYVVERAHNELLQVAAELGVIGLVLLLLPFGLFTVWLLRTISANRSRLSPMLWAAIGGMTAFGVGSMFSSFSFRAVQNGIVFFMVLALAVREIEKANHSRPAAGPRPAFTLAPAVLLCMLLMVAPLAAKGVAEYDVYRAEREADPALSQELLARAVRLDPNYAGAYLLSAGAYAFQKDFGAAAGAIRHGIDGGLGTVPTYSTLAKYYVEAGDMQAAERTFDESLRVFPRSVFLRVRYATVLESDGQTADANVQMSIARGIDARQANGWYAIIKKGSMSAFLAARSDENIAPPAELLPSGVVAEYLDPLPTAQGP